MKHFYHFYVAINNVEDIDLAVDLDEIREIDEQWGKILARVKEEVPADLIDQMTDEIFDRFFS